MVGRILAVLAGLSTLGGCTHIPWSCAQSNDAKLLAEYIQPRADAICHAVEVNARTPHVSTSTPEKEEKTPAEPRPLNLESKSAPAYLPEPTKITMTRTSVSDSTLKISTAVVSHVKDPTPVPLKEVPPVSEVTPKAPEEPSDKESAVRENQPLPVLPAKPAKVDDSLVPVRAEETGNRAPIVEALQCVLDNRHQEALQHLSAYDRETQEFYLRVLPTLTIFSKKNLEQMSPQEVAVLNDQLTDILAKLRPRTELIIEQMCLCDSVKRFGVYRPLKENHSFQSDGSDQAHLYVEVRNFACEPNREKHFVTKLSYSLEIRNSAGEKLHEFKFNNEAPSVSRSRVNDCCREFLFPVPPLPPGLYQLAVQIVDETIADTRRVARKSIEMRVAPGAKVAGR